MLQALIKLKKVMHVQNIVNITPNHKDKTGPGGLFNPRWVCSVAQPPTFSIGLCIQTSNKS